MMKESVLKATYGEKWKGKVIIANGKIKRKNIENMDRRYATNPAQWWDEECEQVLKNRKESFKEGRIKLWKTT